MRDFGFKDEIFTSAMDEDVEFMPLMTLEEEEEDSNVKSEYPSVMPIIPLRNTVLYPGIVLPITVGRDKSLKAANEAYRSNKLVGLVAQQDLTIEDPGFEHVYKIGTIARIVKQLKMPDGSTTIIIQGKKRFILGDIVQEDPFMKAHVKVLEDTGDVHQREFIAVISSIKDLASGIIKISPNIPTEAGIVLRNINSPVFLMHFISSNLQIEVADKQKILETLDLNARAQLIFKYMQSEMQMLELKNQIQSKVRTDIEKQQRDYFLNQQLKQIQEELGGAPNDAEVNRYIAKAKEKKWPKQAADVFEKEIEKLQRINPNAAEYSVITNYIELLLELPWQEYTKDNFDLKRAKKVLDEDHYGLNKIKDRLLEYLAVLKLKGDLKSPILCLVGPPGVGKTSLGQSVARALERKYVRMSLGGLHDESEIRGHRKTYIGAMPGRIVQSLKRAKSSNPVFILDEVDKVGADFRGDPGSALLEVLDPEQNTTFYDNYLEVEYDLSKVLFIATANNINKIQPALRDRMEIIYVSGYSTEEKIEIAKRHLVPKQRKEHGLKAGDIKLSDAVLEKIIDHYTLESGVRELERTLASVMRKVAKFVATGEKYDKTVKVAALEKLLGIRKYDRNEIFANNPAGVVVGLAWTSVGGEILFVEAITSEGKGILQLTGNLGDVMKESATTALSFIKAHADDIGIPKDTFDNTNIHIHVPEGAIPKDGPSAGITMLTALTSALTGRKVRPYYAMTGEITLRGKVLPVGGIKEKVLAAKRAGIKHIIMSKANEKDVKEINTAFIKDMKFHFVEQMMEVIDLSLLKRKH